MKRLRLVEEKNTEFSQYDDALHTKKGFPGGSNGKEFAGNAGDPVRSLGQEDPLVRKIPWGREWLLTPVFLPGESHERRGLVRYSPWSHKELNMIE